MRPSHGSVPARIQRRDATVTALTDRRDGGAGAGAAARLRVCRVRSEPLGEIRRRRRRRPAGRRLGRGDPRAAIGMLPINVCVRS